MPRYGAGADSDAFDGKKFHYMEMRGVLRTFCVTATRVFVGNNYRAGNACTPINNAAVIIIALKKHQNGGLSEDIRRQRRMKWKFTSRLI